MYVRIFSYSSFDVVHALIYLQQVGNLSFYTTEEQIYELFSKCASPEEGGGVKRIIMGLDRNTRWALLNFGGWR